MVNLSGYIASSLFDIDHLVQNTMYIAESANYASAVFNVQYDIIFTFKTLTRVLENMF